MSFNKFYEELGINAADLKAADAEGGLIEIFQGIDESGDEIFVYLAVKPSKILEYKIKVAEQADMDLSDYGEILYHGKGAYPDAETQKRIEDEFGINHAHAQKFNDELDKFITENVNA